jgi:S1-C subfamily serine protease
VSALSLDGPGAVRVDAIEPDSPAARAGLREGDMIIGLDGQPVASADRLHQLLDGSRIGREMMLKLLRGSMPPEVMYLRVQPSARLPA